MKYNLIKQLEDGLHYSGKLLYSYTNCSILMSTGGRGVGKTTWWIIKGLEDYLNFDKQIFYLRRYESELANLDGLLSTARRLLKGFEFRIKTIDGITRMQLKRSRKSKWETFGNITALSLLKSGRGGDWGETIGLFLFDEFQIDNSNHVTNGYLANEYDLFCDLYQSICRNHNIRIVMLSNAYTDLNPYYIAWKITYEPDKIVTNKICAMNPVTGEIDKLYIATERVPEEMSAKVAAGSTSFIMSMQSEIGQTQFFNKNILDNQDWLKKRKTGDTGEYMLSFYDKDNVYSIYYEDGKLYAESGGNKEGMRVYTTSAYNKKPGTKYVKTYRGENSLEILKFIYNMNNLFFSDLATKYAVTDFMRKVKII